MTHKNHHHRPHKSDSPAPPAQTSASFKGEAASKNRLEIVLKCDSAGSQEVVTASLANIKGPEIAASVIHAGVGPIGKADILMAETGSHLIIGFGVEVVPQLAHLLEEHGIEVRLYDVIYKLLEDLTDIAASFRPPANQEQITGTAEVIALFKSSRKGIILGCEVKEGCLTTAAPFRVISAMGPLYSGKINSLHIEKHAVNKAIKGQQVGVKIVDFNKVRLGDLVECYRAEPRQATRPWQPRGGIIRLTG